MTTKRLRVVHIHESGLILTRYLFVHLQFGKELQKLVVDCFLTQLWRQQEHRLYSKSKKIYSYNFKQSATFRYVWVILRYLDGMFPHSRYCIAKTHGNIGEYLIIHYRWLQILNEVLQLKHRYQIIRWSVLIRAKLNNKDTA